MRIQILINAQQQMGLTESTLEATDGGRSGRGEDKKKEDPSVLNATLPEEFTSRFEVLEEVGKGSFGRVYRVRDRKTKAVYAAKRQKCNDSNLKEVSACFKNVTTAPLQAACVQVKLQANVEDEQVVRIFDTVTSPATEEMFIIMEYCEGGNLLQWIKRTRRHNLINQTVSQKAVLY